MFDLRRTGRIEESQLSGANEHKELFDYRLADYEAIETYNRRRKSSSTTRLQVEMGAAPYDGDPYSATIVVLLNNPMFCDNSEPADHTLQFEGWPLAGLHPSVRSGFRDWYRRPLGYLIKRYGAELVSRRVAILQINPWASRSFDLACVLPSRKQQVAIAGNAVERGALVIIGRSIRFWTAEVGTAENIHVARNVRNPTISPTGLGMSQEEFDIRFSACFW